METTSSPTLRKKAEHTHSKDSDHRRLLEGTFQHHGGWCRATHNNFMSHPCTCVLCLTDRRNVMRKFIFRPVAVYKIVLDLLGVSYGRRKNDSGDVMDNVIVEDETMFPSLPPSSPPLPTTTPSKAVVTDTSSEIPSFAPATTIHCGCVECTDEIWNHDAYGFTCGERIDYLQTPKGGNLNEAAACEIVSNQYPTQCGFHQCNPLTCDGRSTSFCGCPECQKDDWYTLVDASFTCGQLIRFLQTHEGVNMTEADACVAISMEFPLECGPKCDPQLCHEPKCNHTCGEQIRNVFWKDENHARNRTYACSMVSEFPLECGACLPADVCDTPICGCSNCSESAWNRPAGDHTCGERIEHLIMDQDYEEWDACREIVNQYPFTCGECHPDKCDNQAPPVCGCESCTEQVWTTDAVARTCGARILYLQSEDGGRMTEKDSCQKIAFDFPFECGICHPEQCSDPTPHPPVCGCQGCAQEIWNRKAGNFTCGQRIRYLQSEEGGSLSESEACTNIGASWPGICGSCNPETCEDGGPKFCGCHDCEERWTKSALGHTCGERIRSFRYSDKSPEEACAHVADQFPGKID